ncbi:MAG TPA: glycerophosphodiester phosphodiesterase family protein [Gemmataceae bacterium]|nr:glycerophosphodiester phosphodiesterase family protein [Gemmataceae bacterium]
MHKHIVEVQGHRGARGLAPENTLAGFEVALDVGVDSIETDAHLSREGTPVLIHDPHIDGRHVRAMSLDELRSRAIPTLADFFTLVAAHAQGERARRLIFDIELKRVPFEPATIGDDFDGVEPGILERAIVETILKAGVVERTRVRSFDHRAVLAAKKLEPRLTTGLLIHNTLPVDIAALLEQARADIYCPDFHFLDARAVQQVIDAGKRVIPYTVNEPSDWQRLIAWGVHGICTDYPDRLVKWLAESA